MTKKVTIEIEKEIMSETECTTKQEEQTTEGDDQGGEDPFFKTKELDSPFIVKRWKSSVGGAWKKKKLDRSISIEPMVLTKGDIVRDLI